MFDLAECQEPKRKPPKSLHELDPNPLSVPPQYRAIVYGPNWRDLMGPDWIGNHPEKWGI